MHTYTVKTLDCLVDGSDRPTYVGLRFSELPPKPLKPFQDSPVALAIEV